MQMKKLVRSHHFTKLKWSLFNINNGSCSTAELKTCTKNVTDYKSCNKIFCYLGVHSPIVSHIKKWFTDENVINLDVN